MDHKESTSLTSSSAMPSNSTSTDLAPSLRPGRDTRQTCNDVIDSYMGMRCIHESPSHPCGELKIFYFNGNDIQPDILLRGLMRLPREVRDHIYELAVAPHRSPTWWLAANGWLFAPRLLSFLAEQPELPTLENQDRPWLSWHSWQFCMIQGFMVSLNKLKSGYPDASACLNDFQNFVGERTVFEVNNFREWREYCKNTQAMEIDPCPWFSNLRPFWKHIRNLSLEFSVPNGREFSDNMHRIPDWTGDFVELCKRIKHCLPILRSLILYFQFDIRQLRDTIRNPKDQPWLECCRLISAEKLNVKVRLREYSEYRECKTGTNTYRNESYIRNTGYGTGENEECRYFAFEESILREFLLQSSDSGLGEDTEDFFGLENLFEENSLDAEVNDIQ